MSAFRSFSAFELKTHHSCAGFMPSPDWKIEQYFRFKLKRQSEAKP
jgi:hypothetical protein